MSDERYITIIYKQIKNSIAKEIQMYVVYRTVKSSSNRTPSLLPPPHNSPQKRHFRPNYTPCSSISHEHNPIDRLSPVVDPIGRLPGATEPVERAAAGQVRGRGVGCIGPCDIEVDAPVLVDECVVAGAVRRAVSFRFASAAAGAGGEDAEAVRK